MNVKQIEDSTLHPAFSKGQNSIFILHEINWLESIIKDREKEVTIPNFEYESFDSPYVNIIETNHLDIYDRLLLVIALAQYIKPSVFEPLVDVRTGVKPLQFREGGSISKSGRAFIPTTETFLFLAAGDDIELRISLLKRITKEHPLFGNNILKLEGNSFTHTNLLNKTISITEEFYFKAVLERPFVPDFGTDFPAQLLETKMEWSDLVLNINTIRQIDEFRNWLTYSDVLKDEYGMDRKMQNGYKVLFYGPSGTGKTLTATLLGKDIDRPVYKIDLSSVVSKYIGETEKNLAAIFDIAERKDWILFFDEADALFGKRTVTESSNDRFANQEVSYLLQRIETFEGVAILASNFKSNIDSAFMRRFNSIIYFSLPSVQERLTLWKQTLPDKKDLLKEIDLEEFSKKYELTGAQIVNIVQRSLIEMLSENKQSLSMTMLHTAIAIELMKEGKTI